MKSMLAFGIIMLVISIIAIVGGFVLLKRERKTGMNKGRSKDLLYFGAILLLITIIFVIYGSPR